jgi:hypothetical protein
MAAVRAGLPLLTPVAVTQRHSSVRGCGPGTASGRVDSDAPERRGPGDFPPARDVALAPPPPARAGLG